MVAHRYMTGRFFLDLIVWLPMGYMLSSFDERLKFTWCIKGLRVIDLNHFVSDKFWNPIIRTAFDKLRAYFIRQDKLIVGQEETEDFLFINPLIYCLNI